MGVAGAFNWVDLMTTDHVWGKGLLHRALRLGSQDQPAGDAGVYTMFLSDGLPVAGSGEYRSEQRAQGLPDGVDQLCHGRRVLMPPSPGLCELGGTALMPAMDVMAAGRMAMIAGPTGEVFGIWQDGNHAGAGKFNEPVSLTWNELATTDPEAAEAFYTGVFGWTTEVSTPGSDRTSCSRTMIAPTAGCTT